MNASDHRRAAREALADHWIDAMLVTLVASFLGGSIASTGGRIVLNNDPPVHFVILCSVLVLARMAIGGTILLGHCRYALKLQDHQEAGIADLFSQFEHFMKGFLLKLLSTVFIILWSLLLVIPGIVASLSYSMAPFILYEHPEMSAMDAINASNDMMIGHKRELFCLQLSFIGWSILSVLTLGIGFLFLIPYKSQAYTSFYRYVKGETATVESSNPDTAI